jgi:hypothetical protein
MSLIYTLRRNEELEQERKNLGLAAGLRDRIIMDPDLGG